MLNKNAPAPKGDGVICQLPGDSDAYNSPSFIFQSPLPRVAIPPILAQHYFREPVEVAS